MAFDGSGNYSRIHNWQQDAANAIDISAPEMDAEDNSIGGALNLCVTRDGQGKMTADFTPATDNTLNLGSALKRWASINGVPIPPSTSPWNFFPQTAAEATALVTPVNYFYAPGDVRRYGPVGDGVTDDTTPISNFIKVANASGGLRCYLEKKIYAISAALPQITNNGVMIFGAGTMRHDLGAALTGTIFKWIGAAGATMLTIAPISGAGNQKIGNIIFRGVGFDCNQLANTGLLVQSIFASEIDVGINEAALTGVKLGVVATLGEARDLQDCKITVIGTQQFATGATLLQLVGDAGANVSLNHFWCDLFHTNVRAIDLQGSDNNDWWYVRCFKPGGGTSTESISIEGGANALTCARAERFHYTILTVPIHVYGTGTFTVAAHDIMAYLDKENGTPDIIIDAGATAYQQNSNTPVFDAPWVQYVPVITATVGAFTTVSATGSFLRRGKITHYEAIVTCTTIGTAAGSMKVTMPSPESSTGVNAWIGAGLNTTLGSLCSALVSTTSTFAVVNKYDGTFPITSGQVVIISGFYGSA